MVPEVNLTADRTRVGLGDAVTLTCNVTRANPMPTTYIWTNLDTSDTISEISDTLTLPSITVTDLATYRCEAVNDAGTGMDTVTIEQGGRSRDHHVISCVYCFLVVPVTPNVTARVSPPDPVVQGSTVDLVCEATAGDTPISFSWMNEDGVAVSPEDTDGIISVTLSSAELYGTYTCTATNAIGTETADADVIEAGKDVQCGRGLRLWLACDQ